MKLIRTGTGFESITHRVHGRENTTSVLARAYVPAGEHDLRPGRQDPACLRIGAKHLLNREELAELVRRLQSWLETGSLRLEG